MRRLRMWLVVAACVAAIGVPAFASGSTESASSAGSTAANMRISWWGTQTRHNHFLAVVDLYEKAHPNVKFEPVFTGWDGYWDKMAAEVAGNNAPDVMMMDYTYITQYVSNRLLADLIPFKGNTLDLSSVSDSAIAGGMINGKLYGIPIGLNADSAFLYNPDILKQAGLSDPSDSWTWQDFMKMANQVHQKLGIYGTGTITDSIGYKTLNMWLRAHGQHLFSADGSGLGYTDDSLVTEYLQMLLSLSKSGAMEPVDTWSQHNSQQSFLITLKQAAFQPVSSNAIVASSEAAKTTFRLAFFPGPNIDAAQYVKPSSFWTISQNGKHQKDAAAFIDLFTNNIDAQKIVNAELGVPISSKVRDAMSSALDPAVKEMFDFTGRLVQHSTPIDPPPPAAGAQVQDLLTNLTQEVLYEKSTPGDAAAKFRAGATKILAGK